MHKSSQSPKVRLSIEGWWPVDAMVLYDVVALRCREQMAFVWGILFLLALVALMALMAQRARPGARGAHRAVGLTKRM